MRANSVPEIIDAPILCMKVPATLSGLSKPALFVDHLTISYTGSWSIALTRPAVRANSTPLKPPRRPSSILVRLKH